MAMNRERSLDVRIKVPQSLRFGRTKDGRAFMVVDPSLLDGSATLNSEALRELFIGDLAALTWVRGAIPTDARLPGSAANFLDLLLEPEAAEEAIGNLSELYERRLVVNPGHAKRWLVAQVVWIVFGRAMDVFGRFMRARAGK